MIPWPMNDDDFQAMESERLSESRTQEERETARLQWEAMDALDIEDQDILDRWFQESLAQDPIAQLQQECSEETFVLSEHLETTAQRLMPGDSLQSRERVVPTTSSHMPVAPPPSFFPPRHVERSTQPLQPPTPKQPQPSMPPKLQTTPRHSENSKLTPYEVAHELIESEHFVVIRNAVYHYNGLIYQLLSKEDASRLIVGHCRLAAKEAGNPNFIEQVFKSMLQEPSICNDDLEPSPDELVFLDGVINLRTQTFTSHSFRIFATSYINANYRQGFVSQCPTFDYFASIIANGNPQLERRIWEVIGYLLTQDQRGKVFVLLQGPSDTGKSVFGNFIRGCFNKETVSSLALHSFGSNFALADLIGKRLCIDDDLQAGAINSKAASFLKKMTGGDLLSTDVKYMPRVSFTNTAKMVFATNHAVFTETTDEAFQQRMVVIPFSQIVPRENQDGDFIQRLEQGRDAVVVKALNHYQQLCANKYVFSGTFVVNSTIVNRECLSDQILEFIYGYCEAAEGVWTATEIFYSKFTSLYGGICEKNVFSGILNAIVQINIPFAEKVRRRINGQGNPIGGYKGVKLKANECFAKY